MQQWNSPGSPKNHQVMRRCYVIKIVKLPWFQWSNWMESKLLVSWHELDAGASHGQSMYSLSWVKGIDFGWNLTNNKLGRGDQQNINPNQPKFGEGGGFWGQLHFFNFFFFIIFNNTLHCIIFKTPSQILWRTLFCDLNLAR